MSPPTVNEAFGIENGLVRYNGKWFDQGFVCYARRSVDGDWVNGVIEDIECIECDAKPVYVPELSGARDVDEEGFEEDISKYRQVIMVSISKGIDLYKSWTNGLCTRDGFITIACVEAL